MKFTGYKYLLFFTAVLAGSSAAAQNQKPCKAVLKANRKKTVRILSDSISAKQWSYMEEWPYKVYTSYIVTVRPVQGKSYDTVMVKHPDGRLIATFIADKTRIISPVITVYYENGRIRTSDTLGPLSRKQETKKYFNWFHAGNFSSTSYWNIDGSPCEYVQYDKRGYRITEKKYYENGKPWTYRQYNRQGTDSFTRAWHKNGALLSERTEGAQCSSALGTCRLNIINSYNEQGIVTLTMVDTILKVEATCLTENSVHSRYFYDEGMLKEDNYFNYGDKRHYKIIYDKSGKITYKQKQMKPERPEHKSEPYFKGQVITQDGPAAAWDDFGETAYFDIKAQYNGSHLPEIRTKLMDVLCRGKQEFTGGYFLNYEITADGKARFISLTGLNAEAYTEACKGVFDAMAPWKPATIQGMKVAELHRLKFGVSSL